MEKQPSLKKNFGMNAILTVSSLIFPLITFPYISRILEPKGLGRVSFAISLVSYFSMLSQLGIPTYGVRAAARVRDDKEKLTRLTHELLLINTVLSLISYGILIIAVFFVPKLASDKILYLVTGVSLILDAIGTEWLYKGLEQYTYITVRSIAFKAVSVIAMFLLVHSRTDHVVYAGIVVFAGSGANIVNLINTRKYIDTKPVGGYEPLKHIMPALVFFAMSCATTVYLHLDTVMLGFMTGDTEVGLYHASVRIKQILVSIITSLGVVLLPRLSFLLEQGENEKFRDVCLKAFRFVTAAAIPMMVYFMLFAREAVLFLSGSAYEGSVIPMQIIMPTLLFIGLTNIIGIQIFVPYGEERKVLISEIVGAAVDVVINLLLIPKYGPAGAAAGTLVAEAAVLAVQVYFFKKMADEERYEDLRFPGFFKEMGLIRIIGCLIIAFLLSMAVKHLNLGNFATLALSGVLFFGSYGAVFILTGGMKGLTSS